MYSFQTYYKWKQYIDTDKGSANMNGTYSNQLLVLIWFRSHQDLSNYNIHYNILPKRYGKHSKNFPTTKL